MKPPRYLQQINFGSGAVTDYEQALFDIAVQMFVACKGDKSPDDALDDAASFLRCWVVARKYVVALEQAEENQRAADHQLVLEKRRKAMQP